MPQPKSELFKKGSPTSCPSFSYSYRTNLLGSESAVKLSPEFIEILEQILRWSK
jgi:hypothetical protein